MFRYHNSGNFLNLLTTENSQHSGMIGSISYVFATKVVDIRSAPVEIRCWMDQIRYCLVDEIPDENGKWKYDSLMSTNRAWNRSERMGIRMYYPENEELKQYLLTNREKINPWFREEAIRRGLLDRNGSVN